MGFGSIIGGITKSLIGGSDKAAGMSEQGLADARARFEKADPLLERAGGLSELFINPDDPEFMQIVKQYEEARKRDVIGSITEIIRQNNRAKARGSIGFGLNPERRDESLSSAIGQQFAVSGDAARGQTRDAIMRALTGLQNTAGGYINQGNAFSGAGTRAAQIQMPFDQRGFNQQAGLIEGISSLFDLGVDQLDLGGGSYGGGRDSGVNPHTGQLIMGAGSNWDGTGGRLGGGV